MRETIRWRRPRPRRATRPPPALAVSMIVVGLCTLAPTPAPAQTDPFCFPGRPLPECRVTGLIEGTVVRRVAGRTPPDVNSDPWEATWELGALVNGEDGGAWGGSFLIGTGEYRPRVGLRLRYRRWLDDRWTADLAAGPLTHSTSVEEWGVGASADLAIGYRDYAGLLARVEVLPARGGGTSTAGFVGARLGSWPAVVGSGIAGLVFLVALASADFQ